MSNTITPTVFYRTINVEELEIFYREAGPRDAPTVLLLQSSPTPTPTAASSSSGLIHTADGPESPKRTLRQK
jgi:hypothetical protein